VVGWAGLDKVVPAAVGAVLAGKGIEMTFKAVPGVVLGVTSGPVGVAGVGNIAGSRAGFGGGGIEVVLGALSGSVGLVVS
jgi:hypothetical protein